MGILRMVEVTGWDDACARFTTEATQQRLHAQRTDIKILAERSTKNILVLRKDGAPILFISFMPTTLLGGETFVWMIPFKDLNVRYMREAYKMFDAYARRFTKIFAHVFSCEPVEERFLRFFGFAITVKSHKVTVYERVN